MFLIKGLLILLWLFLIPLLAGCNFSAKDSGGIFFRKAFLNGYLLLFALFEVIAIPLIFLHLPFHILLWTFAALSILLAGLGLIRQREEIWNCLIRLLSAVRPDWTMLAAFAIILVQVGITVLGWHSDADDSFYIGTANTTVATDSMFEIDAYTGEPYESFPSRYVLSPFPVWVAFVSRVIQIHPAATAHTVLPLALIPLAYVVYSLLGEMFFHKDKKKQGVFLLAMGIIMMSSWYSIYTQGTFLLVRIWQGKAVLTSILLPAVLYLLCRLLVKKETDRDWPVLLCAMMAGIMVSTMGVMLPVLAVAIAAFLFGLLKKEWGGLLRSILVCVPNMIFAVLYLIIR